MSVPWLIPRYFTFVCCLQPEYQLGLKTSSRSTSGKSKQANTRKMSRLWATTQTLYLCFVLRPPSILLSTCSGVNLVQSRINHLLSAAPIQYRSFIYYDSVLQSKYSFALLIWNSSQIAFLSLWNQVLLSRSKQELTVCELSSASPSLHFLAQMVCHETFCSFHPAAWSLRNRGSRLNERRYAIVYNESHSAVLWVQTQWWQNWLCRWNLFFYEILGKMQPRPISPRLWRKPLF